MPAKYFAIKSQIQTNFLNIHQITKEDIESDSK